ncbi:MAG: hypothetical protein KDJ15_00605 [Alphaproteobacteria bacterium]|nr:hypothetical protein [Alphaproteobacteria bacterium]
MTIPIAVAEEARDPYGRLREAFLFAGFGDLLYGRIARSILVDQETAIQQLASRSAAIAVLSDPLQNPDLPDGIVMRTITGIRASYRRAAGEADASVTLLYSEAAEPRIKQIIWNMAMAPDIRAQQTGIGYLLAS